MVASGTGSVAGTVNDRYGSVLLEMEWIETEHKRNRK